MNATIGKLLLLVAGSLVAAMLSVFAFEVSQNRTSDLTQLALPERLHHAKRGPGQVMEVWIDDLVIEEKRKQAQTRQDQEITKYTDARKADDFRRYLDQTRKERERYDHAAIVISVPEQQSVLWLSRNYQFRIVGVHPYPDENALPPEFQAVLRNGPFYREFPDQKDRPNDREAFFKQVSSGPAVPSADPGERSPGFQFKATIEIRGQGSARTFFIDPHIMTVHDVGP